MTPGNPSGLVGALVWALLGVAVLVTVASSVGLVTVGDPYRRLHLISPVTVLAAPAVALALTLRNGLGLTTVTVLVTVALLGVTSSALQNAVGRVVARHRGDVSDPEPEQRS